MIWVRDGKRPRAVGGGVGGRGGCETHTGLEVGEHPRGGARFVTVVPKQPESFVSPETVSRILGGA